MRGYRFAGLFVAAVLVLVMAMPASATGNQGCTPGFWKTHPTTWSDYSPTTNILSTIGVSGSAVGLPSNISFATALEGGGGSGLPGAGKILLRAAAAAFLNAASDDGSEVYYPLHRDDTDHPETGIRYMVQHAWGARDSMISVASYLDKLNNLGAPLCS